MQAGVVLVAQVAAEPEEGAVVDGRHVEAAGSIQPRPWRRGGVRIRIQGRWQMQTINLTSHFLIAMPGMADPNFSRSLTFICEHNERGALGLVVNRPTDVTLGTLFRQVEIELDNEPLSSQPVFFGGPVQLEHGFVLHRPLGEWRSTLPVGEIGLTTSRDILEAMARGEGPRERLVALGYAGWAPGQLEDEIKRNGWLTVSANPDVVFRVPPEGRYKAALDALGISSVNLSEEAGHA
jgi:putative transcriptional regulator